VATSALELKELPGNAQPIGLAQQETASLLAQRVNSVTLTRWRKPRLQLKGKRIPTLLHCSTPSIPPLMPRDNATAGISSVRLNRCASLKTSNPEEQYGKLKCQLEIMV